MSLLTIFLLNKPVFNHNCDRVLQVWAGPLSGHRIVVALWNRCSKAATITAGWDALGLESSTSVSVRDLWQVRKLNLEQVFNIRRPKQ